MHPLHEVMLTSAKNLLTKVQDNLRAAGRVEEALHLNKFLEENEKILDKGRRGVLRIEQFEFDDHMDAVNAVLEKYKEYLPKAVKKQVESDLAKIALVVPTTEELYGMYYFQRTPKST